VTSRAPIGTFLAVRGFRSAEGQSLPFPIDFDGRPYNTLTLLCERVIGNTPWGVGWSRDRWRHVIQKGQGRDAIIFEAEYLINRAR